MDHAHGGVTPCRSFNSRSEAFLFLPHSSYRAALGALERAPRYTPSVIMDLLIGQYIRSALLFISWRRRRHQNPGTQHAIRSDRNKNSSFEYAQLFFLASRKPGWTTIC
ncbi:hypothetical protein PM082_004146 [Marasmius tenuissimus]|nr:hypothetical protein PM082_004146 [Marasmius tenuissimus]